MTSLKLTKRALLSSVLALFLCFAMLIGTTFAWFTDSVTSANNKIVSGKLDVELYQWSGEVTENRENATAISTNSAPVFSRDILWEPGYTEVVYLSIKNEGNLALKYKVALEVTDISINSLLDVMTYAITPDATYGEVTSWAGNGVSVDTTISRYHDTAAQDVALLPGEEHFFALSVHMDEEAGNEFMNQFIEFDIKVLAGQLASEEDAFDNTYDADATYPGGAASAPVVAGEDVYLEIRGSNGGKTSTFYIPTEAIDPNASEVKVNVENTVSAGRYDFEIKVEGLVEGNTTPIRVELRLPKALDSDTMKVFHNDVEITSFVYNPISGYVSFDTTSFSPFYVTYDADIIVNYEKYFPKDIPTATVTDVTADWDGSSEDKVIVWEGYDLPFDGPIAEDQKLEAVFNFKAPHNGSNITELAGGYRDWECDYVVSIDRDIKKGSIVLGGNYGSWGWIGFTNPEDIKANDQIPLLGSVTVNPWTYEQVVELVSEFICGIAEANDAPTNLAGATFTVRLRLTNPDNASEYYDVNVVEYTFGSGNIVIE